MGLYDGLKDVAKVVQQADNIELYQKLLDLSAQALDMQDEIRILKERLEELREQENIKEQIERYHAPYITLKNDESKFKYCTNCWDDKQKLIQLHCDDKTGKYKCPCCGDSGVYDSVKSKEYLAKQMSAISSINKPPQRF